MLGIGFGKILVLVAVIAAVWYGFKWLERSGVRISLDGKKPRQRRPAAIDLERDPVTGSYRPPNAGADRRRRG